MCMGLAIAPIAFDIIGVSVVEQNDKGKHIAIGQKSVVLLYLPCSPTTVLRCNFTTHFPLLLLCLISLEFATALHFKVILV